MARAACCVIFNEFLDAAEFISFILFCHLFGQTWVRSIANQGKNISVDQLKSEYRCVYGASYVRCYVRCIVTLIDTYSELCGIFVV